MNSFLTPLDAALDWIGRSYSPVPVRAQSKKPYNPDDPEGKHWQDLRITAETANRYFNGAKQNIGVLLGDAHGSADVDLDCPEAVALAPTILPDTGLRFGRPSKPCSHWFYRVDPLIPSLNLSDPADRATLVELRCQDKDGSIGHHTVVPPSIHTSGEPVQFEAGFDGEPATIDAAHLQSAVKKLAAAALLVRHWPKAGEGRHETMLALAGLLLRAQWAEVDVVQFCIEIYRAVPDHDPEALVRTEAEVQDTFRTASEGKPITGLPTLQERFDGKILRRVLEWLNLRPQAKPHPANLILNASGDPRPLLANAITALRAYGAWRGVLGFNEFSLTVHAVKPTPWGHSGSWTDNDDRLTADWLQRTCGVFLQVAVVAEAIQAVAIENPFHPVREYLDGLVWDGASRIDGWLSLYMGVDASDYSAAVGERWLISAVARIYKPGCKADCVLILEGAQGLGKSRALSILAGPWFTDEIADLGSKDATMQLLGVWILEIAELDSMTRAEVSRVKAFLSRATDRFRPPYGRRLIEQPRQCVFVGTVNASDYLRDETGNRRFWPVCCSLARLAELERDRDQIWAEAVHRYKQGAAWWLDEAELVETAHQEQDARLQVDPWRILIENYVADRDKVTTAEILSECIQKHKDRWERKDEMRVGAVLRAMRWERSKRRVLGGGNTSERCYQRPAG